MKKVIQNTPQIPVLEKLDFPAEFQFTKLSSGKVRDRFETPDGQMVLVTTDRISAFDIVLGSIPGKGQVLTQLSEYWLKNTTDIIPNHLIAVPDPNVMIVKKASPLPVEVVVRGYMTGSTGTSIWGSYEKGERLIYGIPFRDGYKKNEPLDAPIITPTTKAESGHDQRLTEAEIVSRSIVAPHVWQQVRTAALKLFARGQKIARKQGFILFDTKFEFGLDEVGQPILIDEVLTPDSSRYALAKTLSERVRKGLEPDFYDKERLRLAYKKMGYAGEGSVPKMPIDLRTQMSERYVEIYEALTGNTFIVNPQLIQERIFLNTSKWLLKDQQDKKNKQCVIVIMGSEKDMPHVKKIVTVLHDFGIPFEVRVGSAHKTPLHVLDMLKQYETRSSNIVYIAVAGRSNALGGFIDASTTCPVINAPPPGEVQTIFSSLEMPSGVGVVTVLYPEAAALAAAKILALSNPKLAKQYEKYMKKLRDHVYHADVTIDSTMRRLT